MKFTRRRFLTSVSAAALFIGVPANAWIHGISGPPPLNITLDTPKTTVASSTALTLTVNSSQTGTLYWVVSQNGSPPTSTQIKAGQDSTGAAGTASGSQTVSATGAQSVSVAGLTAGTPYYAFGIQTSGAVQSNIARWQQVIPADINGVHIFEISMATPDIVRVEVRDGFRTPGNIETTTGASYGTPGTYGSGTNPGSGGSAYYILNLDGKARLWTPILTTNFFNQAASIIPGDYGTLGGQTVTAVYHLNQPYDQTGQFTAAGTGTQGGGFQHFLYLQLSGALANGSHNIVFPAGTGLGTVPFYFNDKVTRSCGTQWNQHGHRPDDSNKSGNLGLWIPGFPTNNSVDYSGYGIATHQILDAAGNSVYSAAFPAAFETPTATASLMWDYTDYSVPPFVATAVTKANPGLVTYSGTGWAIANGDKIRFHGTSGMTQLEGQGPSGAAAAYTVSNLDTVAKTFNINQDTSTFSTLTTGTYTAPTVENAIYRTYHGNLHGLYSFWLDVSLWAPSSNGTYYHYIPGVGVSYPFYIDQAVYYYGAKINCGGYYNQLMGTALDGRFGYTRPISFKDGVNGVQWKFSTLPACFGSEWSFAFPTIPSSNLGLVAWQTSNRVTGLIPEFFDAGDWDAAAQPHGQMAYAMLDLYDFLPAGLQDIKFGFPLSTQSFDPTFYAGTDSLGDLVHQGIWWAQAYLSTMQADGSCASGFGYSDGGGGPNVAEPSCYSFHTTWLYAADPPNNYVIAGVAGKLATIMYRAYARLGTANLKTLGDYYLAKAKSAMAWADSIFLSNSFNGGDGTVQDAYFIGQLNLQTNAGWSGAQYTSAMTSITGFTVSNKLRYFAAACIFRATSYQPGGSPDTTYSTIVESSGIGNPLVGYTANGIWEYCQANYTSATHTTWVNYNFGITHGWPSASGYGTGSQYSVISNNYNLARPDTRDTVSNLYRTIIICQTPGFTQPTMVANIYAYMQAICSCFWGANPTHRSMTSGIGSRWQNNMLLRDKEALQLTQMPPGFSAYTISGFPGFGNFNFASGANSTSTTNWTAGVNSATVPNAAKVLYPDQYAYPQWEGSIDNSYVVNWSEFTTEQSIISMQIWTQLLHARGGNTATTYQFAAAA